MIFQKWQKFQWHFLPCYLSHFSIRFLGKMRVHDIINSTKDYRISSKFAGMRDETVIGDIYFETNYSLLEKRFCYYCTKYYLDL